MFFKSCEHSILNVYTHPHIYKLMCAHTFGQAITTIHVEAVTVDSIDLGLRIEFQLLT